MDLFFLINLLNIFYCFPPQHPWTIGSEISCPAEKIITFLPVLSQLYASFMDVADSYPE